MSDFIEIKGAREHNLKGFDVRIPHNQITVVTGKSGSGKSSLVHDIIYKEASRRYFSTYSSYARHYLGKIGRAKADSVTGLTPVLSLNQAISHYSSSSTVGTLTELTDILRLLFARAGQFPEGFRGKKSRSLFSFNSPEGMCPHCRGVGRTEHISLDALITDPGKSIRERVFSITTDNGYVMYSQVTLDVLNTVCQAHGFTIDIPWNQMTDDQKQVVLYGSDRIKVPFGKHTLESRMKWTGITAKPRDEGYYRGIIPVMEEILKRDRNKNILKYAESRVCSQCGGSRLNDQARSVMFHGKNIAEYSGMTVKELDAMFSVILEKESDSEIIEPMLRQCLRKTGLLKKLGLSHLVLSRESSTLSGGEVRRSKLAVMGLSDIRGVTYLLDEPSIGLHSSDVENLISILRDLKNRGNTVVVVEHDPDIISSADWIVDIGPGSGVDGGGLVYSGPFDTFFSSPPSASITGLELHKRPVFKKNTVEKKEFLTITALTGNNLKNVSVSLQKGGVNVFTGLSGAGKSSLVHAIKRRFETEGIEKIDRFLYIDQSPVGKNSRSNPATYIKLFDRIRDFFASLPQSKAVGLTKSDFSFNVKGGRCEECQGAGTLSLGMHFLDNIDILCDHCQGQRFSDHVLEVAWRGRHISDVLNMSVSEALDYFRGQSSITHYLNILAELGLSYLTLGQGSSTLSGGEAQRVKLAASLVKPLKKNVMVVFDEPTTGLHRADVRLFLGTVRRLTETGVTVVIVEHDGDVTASADWVVELGPGSGLEGGDIVFQGSVEDIMSASCLTADVLKPKDYVLKGDHTERYFEGNSEKESEKEITHWVSLRDVSTHNLKSVNVSFPLNRMTAVTGVSGSGKSSLLVDTLFSASQDKFSEGLGTYIRSFLRKKNRGQVSTVEGMVPAAFIEKSQGTASPRSTVGTMTGIYDYLRLLISRAGQRICPDCSTVMNDSQCPDCGFTGCSTLTASLFSFNSEHGACPSCHGLGVTLEVDPEKVITDNSLSFFSGAMNGTKPGRFYGDPYGQYLAILDTVGKKKGVDYSVPVNKLSEEALKMAMFGTGTEEFEVNWVYKRKSREGSHVFRSRWEGFAVLIRHEYDRKHKDKRGAVLKDLMTEQLCKKCRGSRLCKEASHVLLNGYTIQDLSDMSVSSLDEVLRQLSDDEKLNRFGSVFDEVFRRTGLIREVGLPYLSLSRKTETISGGELQRLKLINQLTSGLERMIFIFDEPDSGLHLHDRKKVLKVMQALKDNNNTVVTATHSREFIKASDYIIELGPGGGSLGGEKICEGPFSYVCQSNDSQAAGYLNRTVKAELTGQYISKGLVIEQADCRNLNIPYLEIPSGGLIAITGVSGSGKSTLMFDVIWKSYTLGKPSGCASIKGFERFSDVVAVSRIPLAKSPLSSPVTVTGILDFLKREFSKTDYAKNNKLKASMFSYNSKEGACPDCKGQGAVTVSLDFMGDVWTECTSCHGSRYNSSIEKCKLFGKTMPDILSMTVDEAQGFFSFSPRIEEKLGVLKQTGLGYLRLGQPVNTLSPGEISRLKLASHIINAAGNSVLFLFDEPSSGLFFPDQEHLLILFRDLVKQGHTVVMIEHSPDMILNSHHVIDLGPEGGEKGGRVMASCSPQALAGRLDTFTGTMLGSLK